MATIEFRAPYNIKIVNANIHTDDFGRITALDLKFRVNDERLNNHIASTVIFSALNVTTFFSDGGSKSVSLSRNERRKDLIYNMEIKINPSDTLRFEDVGKFLDFFQKEITYCQIPFTVELMDPTSAQQYFTSQADSPFCQ